jgi:chromosome segregation ATPase
MSTDTAEKRTTEQIEAELAAATEAERKLAEEANQIAERMRSAASEEKEALQAAANSGKGLKDSSPFLKAHRRAEELPALLWAAQLRRLEVLLEYQACKVEEFDQEKKEAYREIHELEPERWKINERLNDAVARGQAANAEWHDYSRTKAQTAREIAALEKAGPNFDLLKRSTLRPRPKAG